MDYHIGDQIQRKVLKELVPVAQIAKRIGIERQSLYDIFNSNSIKTSRLMDICKVLNYDFFADLSVVFNRSRDEIVNSSDLESNSEIIRRDELNVIQDNYMLDETINRYLKSNSIKPFIVFHACGNSSGLTDIFKRWYVKKWDVSDAGLNEIHRDMMFQQWGAGLKIVDNLSFMTLVYNGREYSNAVSNCVELMQTSGRHIVIFISVDNMLRAGMSGGLVYEDIADDLFKIWRNDAHMIVAQPQGSHYLKRKEYYRAYCGDGIFDRMVRQLGINDNIEKQLLDWTIGCHILNAEQMLAPDETGYSRIKLSYPKPDETEKQLLFANGVNDSPRLEMWIDVRYGVIIDYQYRLLQHN